jgi:hypothetical protein
MSEVTPAITLADEHWKIGRWLAFAVGVFVISKVGEGWGSPLGASPSYWVWLTNRMFLVQAPIVEVCGVLLLLQFRAPGASWREFWCAILRVSRSSVPSFFQPASRKSTSGVIRGGIG